MTGVPQGSAPRPTQTSQAVCRRIVIPDPLHYDALQIDLRISNRFGCLPIGSQGYFAGIQRLFNWFGLATSRGGRTSNSLLIVGLGLCPGLLSILPDRWPAPDLPWNCKSIKEGHVHWLDNGSCDGSGSRGTYRGIIG